jgi:hypothetical protein
VKRAFVEKANSDRIRLKKRRMIVFLRPLNPMTDLNAFLIVRQLFLIRLIVAFGNHYPGD